MKVKKRILHIRKQSRIESPKENLWFYSEDSATKQSPEIKRKTARNDRLNILMDDYSRSKKRYSEKNKVQEDCTFVVDWQLSDTI